MAKKVNEKGMKKVKKPQTQKIIVEEGRHPLFGTEIPHKVLYTEKVASAEIAKERVKELQAEYPNKSIHYFSV